MKYAIALIIMIGCCSAVDDLDRLEQSYLNKAGTLQTNRDNIVNNADDKLIKDSRRLAEAYLKALKVLLKTETQKGDFDKATAVKAKIVEMENILKGIDVISTITKNVIADDDDNIYDWDDPIVGLYTKCIDQGRVNDWNARIDSNGTFEIIFLNNKSRNYSGKWKKENNVYTFTYPHPTSYSKLTLKNGALIGKHYYKGKINQANRIWTGKKIINPLSKFKGTWEISNRFETIIYEVRDNEVWHNYIKNGTTSYSTPQKVEHIIIDGILGMPHIDWAGSGKPMGTKYNWIDLKNNRAIHTNQKAPSGTSGEFRKLKRIVPEKDLMTWVQGKWDHPNYIFSMNANKAIFTGRKRGNGIYNFTMRQSGKIFYLKPKNPANNWTAELTKIDNNTLQYYCPANKWTAIFKRQNNAEKTLGYKLGRHPIGAKAYNGHYYKFIKESITWKGAQAKCKEMGGYLVVPTTKKELEFIYDLTKEKHSGHYIWMGGNVVKSEVKWITGENNVEKFKHHPRFYGSFMALYGKMELLGTTGTGKNSARSKWLVGGYICEWEK